MRARGAAVLLVTVLASGCRPAQQADRGYTVQPARGASTPARVLFDHAHQNFHRLDARYAPFRELVSDAGFQIRAMEAWFDERNLAATDVVVVVTPRPERGLPDGETFSRSELDALQRFVERGGGLLLVTDIPPFCAPSAALAARFGVRLSEGMADDPDHRNPELPRTTNLRFTRDAGLLADHPIFDGESPAERVQAVSTFTGHSLVPPPDATVLIRFGPNAVEKRLDGDLMPTRMGPRWQPRTGPSRRIGGAAQAVAVEHGRGRVVAVGEAGLFTAQIVAGGTKIGMNVKGADNGQFAVNTLRWLSRR